MTDLRGAIDAVQTGERVSRHAYSGLIAERTITPVFRDPPAAPRG